MDVEQKVEDVRFFSKNRTVFSPLFWSHTSRNVNKRKTVRDVLSTYMIHSLFRFVENDKEGICTSVSTKNNSSLS